MNWLFNITVFCGIQGFHRGRVHRSVHGELLNAKLDQQSSAQSSVTKWCKEQQQEKRVLSGENRVSSSTSGTQRPLKGENTHRTTEGEVSLFYNCKIIYVIGFWVIIVKCVCVFFKGLFYRLDLVMINVHMEAWTLNRAFSTRIYFRSLS